MKNLKIFLISLGFILLNTQSVLAATCEWNGEAVPCEGFEKWFILIPVIGLILTLPITVFWIAMLIHAIRNQKEDKVVWILVIIFLQVLGALIYYFAEKRPNDQAKKSGRTVEKKSSPKTFA